jgi:hypothetical protein
VGGKKRGQDAKVPHKEKTVVFTLISGTGKPVPGGSGRQGEDPEGDHPPQRRGNGKIMTDEMASYVGLEKEFASHGSVNHSAEEYVRGIIHVNSPSPTSPS